MKHLIFLINETESVIHFKNTECERDAQVLAPHEAFATEAHIDIPDNSDSPKYFTEHHLAILDANKETLYSIWADDHQNYRLYCCKGTEWRDSEVVAGYSGGGNGANVGLILTSDLKLKAVAVQKV